MEKWIAKPSGNRGPRVSVTRPKPQRSPRRQPLLPAISTDVSAAVPIAPRSCGSPRPTLFRRKTLYSRYHSLPGAPITPADALDQYSNIMTDRERSEITGFRHIFYIRKERPSPLSHMVHDPEFYPFVQDDHICFRYQQLSQVGRGAFGNVIRCFDHKEQREVAIKLVREMPNIARQVDQEIEVARALMMREAASENKIVKIYDVFKFRSFAVFVLEILSVNLYVGMTCGKVCTTIPLQRLQPIMRDVAMALSYVHELGLIHCDLKPENVLWTGLRKNAVKLIDFGCCCYAGRPMFSYVQSRFYRAPEVVLGLEYGKEIDIWSFGCLICELITGVPLFPGKNEEEQMTLFVSVLGPPPEKVIAESPRRHLYFRQDGKPLHGDGTRVGSLASIVRDNDPMLASLIQQCLMWDPSARLKAQQIVRHPWMGRSTKGVTL